MAGICNRFLHPTHCGRGAAPECYDYSQSAHPPVLHRKETFLRNDDERVEMFARLTAQEEKYGRLDGASAIGTRDGWQRRLVERELALKGHRLVRAEPTQAASATAP